MKKIRQTITVDPRIYKAARENCLNFSAAASEGVMNKLNQMGVDICED